MLQWRWCRRNCEIRYYYDLRMDADHDETFINFDIYYTL